jgi:hypothetical protein
MDVPSDVRGAPCFQSEAMRLVTTNVFKKRFQPVFSPMPTLQKIFNPDGNSMIEHEREDKVTSPTTLLAKVIYSLGNSKTMVPHISHSP